VSFAVQFPGQGSQRAGAGHAWRDHPAWSVVERAEEALGEPLAPLLLDADAEALGRTRASQLQVLLLSLMAWEAAAPELGVPVAFSGHSLGQVTALIASGAVGFDDGIRFAAARATATQAAADASGGAMLALLGATEAQAREACGVAPDACWIANLNAPGQVVVAGTSHGVAAVGASAADHGIRRTRALDVGGAFHTPLMAPAADALAGTLAATTFRDTTVPVVTNHDALPHTDAAGWPERLARHLVEPVRWQHCVDTVVDLGAGRLVEIGPGATLNALAKRIVPDTPTSSIETPEHLMTGAKP
jgi:[acyl-carrier-protein] S-malonyltransferase